MPPVLTWRVYRPQPISWEKTAAVAVKIKLKRMGKIRAPYYRIIVADARTKRDGRAIEEIGRYHPKVEPSLIEVNSERAQHWLSVGAQPTDPVRRIFEITGDWQKFKGLPGTEGTLKTAEAKADKREAFAAAVAETLKTAEAKPDKGKARKPAAETDTAKAKDAKASSGKAAKTDGKRVGAARSGKGTQARSAAGDSEPAAADGAAAKDSAAAAVADGAAAGRTAQPLPRTAQPLPRTAQPLPRTAQPLPRTAQPLPRPARIRRPRAASRTARREVLEEALEHLVKGIVDHPDDVRVNSHGLRRGRVLEVRVHPDDLGKVIGRGGRTARALRTVIGSLAGGRYVRVDLLDVDEVR